MHGSHLAHITFREDVQCADDMMIFSHLYLQDVTMHSCPREAILVTVLAEIFK